MSDYDDEAELDIIIDAGVREAADLDARWLNPPHPVFGRFIQRNAQGDVLFDSEDQ